MSLSKGSTCNIPAAISCLTHSCVIVMIPYKYRILVDLWCGTSERLELNTELSSNAKTKWWDSKNHERPRNPWNPSYLCYFLVLATHVCWKWWHRRTGKDRAAHGSVFPYSTVNQRRKVLVEYEDKKKWNKNDCLFWAMFSLSSKNKRHMHVWVMKNALCNISDSASELSALYKTVLAPYKDEWQRFMLIIEFKNFFLYVERQ